MDTLFEWSPEKNKELIDARGISFEEIIAAINNHKLLEILDHPNKIKYSHQKIYVVEMSGYVYFVPFVQAKNKIFLKTIIPSRKLTKQYLSKEDV